MKKKAICIALLAMGSAASASAADLPKEGQYNYIACWSGVSNQINFSKAQSGFSFEMTGSTRSNPPGGMFDKNTFRCVGTNVSLDGKNSGMSLCETMDPDGDKRLAYFTTVEGKVTRQEVGGTGKYDHQTGSYKMK